MKLKPGQCCTIDGNQYRARKKTAGCEDCYFEDASLLCPGAFTKQIPQKVNCLRDNIILERVHY